MVGRLRFQAPTPRRSVGLLLLLVAVALMHGLLSIGLWRTLQGWQAGARLPSRIELSFVRELQPRQLALPVRPAAATPVPALPLPVAPLGPLALAAAASAPTVPSLPATPPAVSSEPVVAAASASVAPAGAAGFEPGPEWPLSTQLNYALRGHYRGEVSGQAQVQWIRQGSRYQVHLDVDVGPSFAPLIQRRMSSDGRLTPEGIAPGRYDEDTRVLLRSPRRAHIEFDHRAQLLRLPGQPEPLPLPPGVQDTASQFVHLTWLFLTGRATPRPGLVLEMPLALPRRLYAWRYEVLGLERLNTPMGPLDAWHLQPRVERPPRSTDLSAEVWVAPALQYLPVRLRIEQDAETYLDLTLDRVPLQAAQ